MNLQTLLLNDGHPTVLGFSAQYVSIDWLAAHARHYAVIARQQALISGHPHHPGFYRQYSSTEIPWEQTRHCGVIAAQHALYGQPIVLGFLEQKLSTVWLEAHAIHLAVIALQHGRRIGHPTVYGSILHSSSTEIPFWQAKHSAWKSLQHLFRCLNYSLCDNYFLTVALTSWSIRFLTKVLKLILSKYSVDRGKILSTYCFTSQSSLQLSGSPCAWGWAIMFVASGVVPDSLAISYFALKRSSNSFLSECAGFILSKSCVSSKFCFEFDSIQFVTLSLAAYNFSWQSSIGITRDRPALILLSKVPNKILSIENYITNQA